MSEHRRTADVSVGTTVNGDRLDASKILIYSPDSFGLGHFRRCLKVAEGFKRNSPGHTILLVTGSPHAQKYRLPLGVNLLILPEVVKTGSNRYASRSPSVSFSAISELRQN